MRQPSCGAVCVQGFIVVYSVTVAVTKPVQLPTNTVPDVDRLNGLQLVGAALPEYSVQAPTLYCPFPRQDTVNCPFVTPQPLPSPVQFEPGPGRVTVTVPTDAQAPPNVTYSVLGTVTPGQQMSPPLLLLDELWFALLLGALEEL